MAATLFGWLVDSEKQKEDLDTNPVVGPLGGDWLDLCSNSEAARGKTRHQLNAGGCPEGQFDRLLSSPHKTAWKRGLPELLQPERDVSGPETSFFEAGIGRKLPHGP